MKILLIHNNIDPKTGPGRYLHNIKYILEDNGNLVEIFSFKNKDFNTHFSKHLPSGELMNHNISKNYKTFNYSSRFNIVSNSFFNRDVYNSLDRFINDFKPDIVYLMQFHLKLSSSVIDACKKNSIPIVCRLSDFNFLCAKNIFYREGNQCTKCISSSIYQIKHNCLDNYNYTILDFMVRKYNDTRKIYDYISHFIIPSHTNKLLIENHHLFKNKISSLITPYLNTVSAKTTNYSKNTVFINFGRISIDKGIHFLIESFKKTHHNLLLIGKSDESINEYLSNSTTNIQHIGELNRVDLNRKLTKASFSVHASVWNDNIPNSLIESVSLGIPAILPYSGSFKDLIDNGMPCLTYNYNNISQVLDKASDLSEHGYNKLSQDTYNWATKFFSPSLHYNKLIALFNKFV
jgi:glycosyltransferase involved in cell wall biosynthesis